MTILGIETSCDETAAAVVENGCILHSSVLATSLEIHIKYGGIVPDKAAREQLQSILPVIKEAMSGREPKDIDAIAVTIGPGLIGSLLIGVETAKTLALAWNKPIIPVNHLAGHIYANWITENKTSVPLDLASSPPFLPALVLLVSGGHSDLVLMTDHEQFQYLGGTRDDAAGECFDKCGRLLGLPYPFGPYIEKLAEKHDPNRTVITLPRPLIHSHDYDFSFSGLKTAFLYSYKEAESKNQITEEFKQALAYELQEAVTDSLVKKTLEAAREFMPRSVILAGGVAANKRLREKLLSFVNRELGTTVNLFIPPIKLCTDNAAYIAASAFFNNHSQPINLVEADPSLTLS